MRGRIEARSIPALPWHRASGLRRSSATVLASVRWRSLGSTNWFVLPKTSQSSGIAVTYFGVSSRLFWRIRYRERCGARRAEAESSKFRPAPIHDGIAVYCRSCLCPMRGDGATANEAETSAVSDRCARSEAARDCARAGRSRDASRSSRACPDVDARLRRTHPRAQASRSGRSDCCRCATIVPLNMVGLRGNHFRTSVPRVSRFCSATADVS